jgi:hypothetical protein
MNTKLFFLCLFVYQLLFIFQGIDLSDEGFIATFYQQIFNNPESVQYNFMFWLTGIIGGLYFKAFSFLGLWGLRLGGVLVTTGTALFVFNLLKKYLNQNYLKLGLFLVVIALNNDIKELNYNNISALIYVTVIYFLFNGLKENSFFKLFISGAFVAVNFFIRPPNIVDLGLAVAILYYGYLKGNNLKFIAQQVLAFLTGFLTGTVLVLFAIYLTGHWNVFVNAIHTVYNMGSGSSKHNEVKDYDYGLIKLLAQLRSNNIKSIALSLGVFLGLIGGISIFSVFRNRIAILHKIRRIALYLVGLLLLLLIIKGVITNYSILFFYTGVILLVFALVTITPNSTDKKVLLFCGAYILVTYPFGSSAGIYTAGRYSFWIGLPLALDYLMNIRSLTNRFTFYQGETAGSQKETGNSLQIKVTGEQMSLVKKFIIVVLIFAGIYHSYFYPFFDRRNRLQMHYSMDNKFLHGIYTTKGRAEVINSLLHESAKYVRKGDYVLAYDCIPMYHFLTESVPYIRSPYPWLYETEVFKKELDAAVREKKGLPVVVMQTIQTIGDGSKWPEETLESDYSKWNINQGRNKYLDDFLSVNHYKEVWTNHYFKIFVPG